jgi:UDP-N-acetyl-2-amino-2-deoxyglucuronate dehydrogenase
MDPHALVRFGLIGCGKIGTKHAEEISKNPQAKLVAVCDVLDERVKRIGEKYGAKQYLSHLDMLKDPEIDVVNVCTPSGLHAKISIDAANHKKNVLCEKPMALNVPDGLAMIDAANQNSLNLFIVKQNRFNQPVAYLKKAIDENKMGKVYMITSNVYWNRNPQYYSEEPWRGTWSLDGGALLTQSSHFVDLMQWLGGPVKAVYAQMGNYDHPNIETEDTGAMILKYESGALGILQYTTCIYPKNLEGSITVLGTNGTVKVGGGYLSQLDFWDVKDLPKPDITEKLKPNDYGTYQGSASNHGKVIQNVIDVLNGKDNIATSGAEGLKTVEIIIAAHLSARTGKEIRLPLGEEYANYRL